MSGSATKAFTSKPFGTVILAMASSGLRNFALLVGVAPQREAPRARESVKTVSWFFIWGAVLVFPF